MESVISQVSEINEREGAVARAGRVWRSLRATMHSETGYAGGTTTRDDVRAVRCLIHSGASLLDGQQIHEFQDELSQYLGSPNVTTYGAARMALYVLLKAMGLREGDEIILPGYNCIVIPNAIRFAGLHPVYVDIRESDLNIDPDLVERAITPRTRAVIVQHTFGVPADMDALADICSRRGLPLIEDCAHALGAELDGRKLGTMGYAGFYSTEATKMLSTEKGGILVTTDAPLAARIEATYRELPFRNPAYELLMAKRFIMRGWSERGAIQFPVSLLRILDFKSGLRRMARIERYDADDYAAELAGRRAEPYPCKLSAVMSVAGLGQLRRIDRDIEHRRMLARELEQILPAAGAQVLEYDRTRGRPSWVRFPFIVDDPALWATRLTECGLKPGVWLNDPCHPRGSNGEFAMYRRGSCPVAERVSQRILNVPVHSMVELACIKRLEQYCGRSANFASVGS